MKNNTCNTRDNTTPYIKELTEDFLWEYNLTPTEAIFILSDIIGEYDKYKDTVPDVDLIGLDEYPFFERIRKCYDLKNQYKNSDEEEPDFYDNYEVDEGDYENENEDAYVLTEKGYNECLKEDKDVEKEPKSNPNSPIIEIPKNIYKEDKNFPCCKNCKDGFRYIDMNIEGDYFCLKRNVKTAKDCICGNFEKKDLKND